MELFAKELSNKRVVERNGANVGKLYNLTMDYKTGDLKNLVVEPDSSTTEKQRQRAKYRLNEDGRYVIPSSRVESVRDNLVVS